LISVFWVTGIIDTGHHIWPCISYFRWAVQQDGPMLSLIYVLYWRISVPNFT
jgi:hypothetical protein